MIRAYYDEFIEKSLEKLDQEFPNQTGVLKKAFGKEYKLRMTTFLTTFVTQRFFILDEKEELEIELDFLITHLKNAFKHYLLDVKKGEQTIRLEVSIELSMHELALACLALFNEGAFKYQFHNKGLDYVEDNYLSEITLKMIKVEDYPHIELYYLDHCIQIDLVDVITMESLDEKMVVKPLSGTNFTEEELQKMMKDLDKDYELYDYLNIK